MTDVWQEYDQPDRDDSAAAAFAQLGGEVLALRRAIEGLTAARDVEVPDYAPTLTRTEQLLVGLTDRIGTVVDSPALTMTPEMMTTKIVNASHSARLDDQRLINEARAALERATDELTQRLASERGHDDQNRSLNWVAAEALVAGALLWAVLAGPIARVMPRAWHWPERMAARTLDEPVWVAGQELMASANPEAWHAIVIDEAIARRNRAAYEGLRTTAGRMAPVTRRVAEGAGP